MKRAAALLILSAMLAAISTGCEEDTTDVSRTGLEMRFADCLTFGVHIFVNDTYQGTCSSEEPRFYPLAPGSYDLYARSNANLGGTFYCWNTEISVSDGNITIVRLSCDGAECPE